MTIPIAVLTADWHIRPTAPINRIDDYISSQFHSMKYVLKEAKKLNAPIIHAGDLGHSWNWPLSLLSQFYSVWKSSYSSSPIYVLPGQHDLKYHQPDSWKTSGLGILEKMGVVQVLTKPVSITKNGINAAFHPKQFHEPEWPEMPEIGTHHIDVIVGHDLYLNSSKNQWERSQKSYKSVFKSKKLADVFLFGDNHQSFSAQQGNQWFVSPGSLEQMTTAQKDHEPSIYVLSWDAAKTKWDAAKTKIERKKINRDWKPVQFRELSEELDIRGNEKLAGIRDFIDELGKVEEISTSFISTIQKLQLKLEDVDVNSILQEILEGEK